MSFMHSSRAIVFPIVLAQAGCGGGAVPPERPHPVGRSNEGTPRAPSVDMSGDTTRVEASIHAALGVPFDRDASDDFLMDKGAYVLSYNSKRNVANWVSWRLTKADLGMADRQNDFRADDALPATFYHVTPKDYLRSGFDRGHLCPSADRTRTKDENSLTFLMTNMHPQRPEMNQVTWKKVEELERKLVEDGENELYITVGGIFSATPETIGNGVTVPAFSYKVIVVTRPGVRAADLTRDTRVLAVSMPNTKEVKERPFTDYAVTVDAIEEASGYELLHKVPVAVQAVLESRREPLSR